MIRSLLIAVPVLMGTTLFAQSQYTIEGIVVSHNDSSAVAFASIYVDEQTGTIGNQDGYFKLTSGKPIKTLTISHVNYETLKLAEGDLFNGVNKVYLVERSFQLREITVSGNTAETEIKLAVGNSSQAAMVPVCSST
jgi:hypothetical protein